MVGMPEVLVNWKGSRDRLYRGLKEGPTLPTAGSWTSGLRPYEKHISVTSSVWVWVIGN